ncbi:Zinc finger CCCH domain-containing protein 59 [Acorus gramineus]|uniref:Zinc finger CCCH domain-containing protein 59 n=1 Tax=Acorus gramineus TaxID=55184 RepID=A0AAV9BR59_ACOGR|nr:Zinc finger CCCH domain-containing protein 59 [Acorus gramineus]
MVYPEPTISTPTDDVRPPSDAAKDLPRRGTHRPLAVLSGHSGSVTCLALCGEFLLSASTANDIIVWQQPDLRRFAAFGRGDGSVKALAAAGNRVFTAHQDRRIRVWEVSRGRSENAFRLIATLPTKRDYLGRCLKQSNYVQTRRNHKKLWIEHADSISCLAVSGGLIYSGSWDKTLKVWRVSDLKCLESIKAHDDAINGLVAHKGEVFTASADGKIKVWGRGGGGGHCLKGVLQGHKEVSMNSVIVCEEGRLVYGGGSDGGLMGWRGEGVEGEWGVVCDVKAHKMAVLCVCLMGEFVCSGSADRTIGIWKREGGGCGGLVRLGSINGHEGPVKCLQGSAYSVGGGFLLYSGGLDRSLRVWWVPKEYEPEKQEGEVQNWKGLSKECVLLC